MTVDRLEAVELLRIELPLRHPFETSAGTMTTRPLVILHVLAADGEGWGECEALGEPTYTEEHADGAERMLVEHLVPRLLSGPRAGPPTGQPTGPIAGPPTTLGEPDHGAGIGGGGAAGEQASGPVGRPVWAAMDRLAPVRGQPMAKAGIEMALLDLQLRRAGLGLASWVGATAARVPAGTTVPLLPGTAATVAVAVEAAGRGYRRLKLKIAPGRDVERVAAVRESLPGIALLADANGAYRRGEGRHMAALRELDGMGLLALEQPLPAADVTGHVRLAAELATPVMLDESLACPEDLDVLAALGFRGAVSIKAARLGGLAPALEALARARRAGLHAAIGGMLESGLGRRAALALAARPELDLPGELSPTGEYLAEDVAPPLLLSAGELEVPVEPGVGVLPCPAALAACTVRKHVLRPA